MSASLGVRRSLLAAGAGALMLVGACSDQTVSGPATKPELVILQSVVVTPWDFAALIGTTSGVQDWGASKTIPNGSFGSMVASVTGTITHVTSKGLENPVGDTERGLGLCYIIAPASACTGDEVGDDSRVDITPFSHLYLNLNGVLPAGSTLTQIDLGSVQTTEGWKISYSTTGIGGPFSLLSSGEGLGGNNVGDNVTITGAPLPLPTANLVLRFEKNTAASGNASADNDYVLKSVTTSSVTSSGCTFTWGYWKNHAGDGPQADAWPASVTSGGLTLGTVHYTKTQLLAILNTPVGKKNGGNGLIALAHQLIAAKINIVNGADPSAISASITAADALIGALVVPSVGSGFLDPSVTSSLVNALDAYNTGTTGPGHCADEVL